MENIVNTGAGALLHLKEGLNVLVLSNIDQNKCFVGTDGDQFLRYHIGKEARFCTSEEADKVLKKLKDKGIRYCYDCFELEPCFTTQEEIERRVGKKNKADDIQKCIEDFFSKIGELIEDED